MTFREDDRVDITAPGDRDLVQLPVDIAWTSTSLPPGTRFGVFVDRTPQPPGETLRWIARNDDRCVASPVCPDASYLADRFIYVTDETFIEISAVPVRSADRRYRDFHEVTVVLLDQDGQRQGESAWSVQFRVGSPR